MSFIQKKILVVDDDWRLLQLVGAWLDIASFRNELVANPFEAIRLINEQAFDCFILDYRMPGMTGFDLLKYIRSMPEHAHTPILFMTAEQNDDLAVSLLNAGADDYLSKPLSEALFLSKLQTNLKKSLIKREINSKTIHDNINDDSGIILFCTTENNNSFIPYFQSKISVMHSFNQLSAHIANQIVWLIVIDGGAQWTINAIDKIQQWCGQEIPLLLIANNNEQAHQLQNQVSHFVLKDFGIEYLNQQIQFIVNREKTIKEKYINSLQQASGSILSGVNRYLEKRTGNMYMSALHEPFSNIPGGDFYEILPFDNQHQLLFIGDVMGKSWNAWFFVPAYIAYIKSTIRVMAFKNNASLMHSPGAILEMLNYYISKDLQTANVFTTLTLAVINSNTGKLHLASAGGINPLIYHQKSSSVLRLPLQGVLLGISDDTRYQTTEYQLEVGDSILFFTDGYIDCIDSKSNEMIGIKGMENTFSSCIEQNHLSAIQFENELLNTFSITKFEDDRTVAILQRLA